MTQKKSLTIRNVSQILHKRGLISDEQYQELLARGGSYAHLHELQFAETGKAAAELEPEDIIYPVRSILRRRGGVRTFS